MRAVHHPSKLKSVHSLLTFRRAVACGRVIREEVRSNDRNIRSYVLVLDRGGEDDGERFEPSGCLTSHIAMMESEEI